MNDKCPICEKSMNFDSHLVWHEHEGFLSLTMSKDAESLERVGHKAKVCQFCSIKTLSQLLSFEMDNLSQIIGLAQGGIPPTTPQ